MEKRTRVEIVPATVEDLAVVFNGLPPSRTRAFAGKLDGRTLGVGGLYYLPDHTRAAFLVLSEEGRHYPRELYRATFWFLDLLKQEGVRSVIAVADPSIDKAEHFLKRIGFVPLVINGQVVYQWHAPTQS